ncbi:centrosomal protein 43-like [Oncorhynchus nerka]|uniref:centrosomal protein 43-like n=1 Tax=Oncorhynchus nerka TaxID=8023 RepID=UPI0031B8139F
MNMGKQREWFTLIIDFLQVFHVDFTLAVFQPEINSLNGLDSCEQVSRDLGITETDMNRTTPLLLELVKRDRHREKASIFSAVKTHHSFVHSLREESLSGRSPSSFVHSLREESLSGRSPSSFVHSMREESLSGRSPSSFVHSLREESLSGRSPSSFLHCLREESLSPSSFLHCLREESLSGRSPSSFVHSLREESLSGCSPSSFVHSEGGEPLRALPKQLHMEPCLFRSSPRRAADLGRGVVSSTLVSLLLDPASQRSAAGGGVPRRRIPPQRPLRQQERHPSDISKSEVSIGGEIEEVSVEGPDNSNKFDEITQDLSVSQLSQTQGADYMEVVA